MKTTRNTITTIAAAIALIASAATSQAVNRTLILLDENGSGKVPMTDVSIFDPIRTELAAIYNAFVPHPFDPSPAETPKFRALADGRYQRFVAFSNFDATRANLLNELIQQSKDGYTVDLAILGGAGGSESLHLGSGELLTGRTFNTVTLPGGSTFTFAVPGTIRSLLTDARAQEGASFNFKLRLVYMSNDFGSSLNDDWLAIGAKASVGTTRRNFMPEPMITFFWDGFVKSDKRVAQAAADSFTEAGLVYANAGLSEAYETRDPVTGLNKFDESTPIVAGNRDLIFKDEFQLALNESRTVTVRANNPHNSGQVYLVAGQRYTYTASATAPWTNGTTHTTTNANGYVRTPFDGIPRFGANMMRLIGERSTHGGTGFINGSGFSIGTSLTATAGGHGFLSLYANDNINSYSDNSGLVSVTITRIQ